MFVKDELIGKLIKKECLCDEDSDNFENEIDVLKNPILFGDFRSDENIRLYEELDSYETVKNIFEGYLKVYNENNKEMNLVLFQDALEHLTRIHRILRLPRGNALLVGVGGSGKQSLTRLAALVADCQLFEVHLTRNYSEIEFREDLKQLYYLLGIENGGSSVVFLFTDAHVVEEGFLELINNMLTSGMVPALFGDDEKTEIIEAVRNEVVAKGMIDKKESCWNYFVNKCRDNLHVVLAMSPAGETLRKRCRDFPGLVSNTVIDWFFPWPKDALSDVANHFLKDIELPEQHRNSIVEHVVNVHLSVVKYSERFEIEMRRANSVTPKNYLDFLNNYQTQLKTFRKENEAKAKRLSGGLEKLIQAAKDVDELKDELSEKKIVVDQKSKECAAMIQEIKERSGEASNKQKESKEKDLQLKEDAIRIVSEKKLAEEALEEALPALQAAAEALKNLKKEDISEVKALANPPIAVKNVCQCVLELKPTGQEDPSLGWMGVKIMMGDVSFLKHLQNYPRDDLTEKMYKNVQRILKKKTDPKSALTLNNLERISKAGRGLLQWVQSIVLYHEVAKNVAPRRLKVQQMEKEMANSQRMLAKIKKDLEHLEIEINRLSSDYEEKSSELKDLTDQAEVMEKHLTAAAKLIDGLSSERIRWTADKQELGVTAERLVGDCLLTSSFLSYTGAFTFDYRKQMIYDDWQSKILEYNIPITQPFKLEALLTNEVEMSQWISEGLPSDELSIQNGILTSRASRFPLCIDPQMQALKWIKQKEGEKLKTRSFNDNDFLKILELSIQFGNPFVFEGVDEEIDPIIDSILERNFVGSTGQKQVILGDKQIDYDDEFRLYLVSKLSNPKYSPEIAGKTMVINYSVTRQGLEDQLLDVVVGHERPDLQKQREELIQTTSRNKIILAQLEDTLLRELTNSTGNILENEILISTLESAKAKSVSIAKQLEESKQTAKELEEVAACYRQVAKRGSILFFSMASLSNVSRMYEYSLNSYLELFKRALRESEKDQNIPRRLRLIISYLTKMVYNYVCLGIFEKHKLMFSLQMVTMLMDGEGTLKRDELDFFLKGDISLEELSEPSPAEWISSTSWKDLQKLITIGGSDGQFSSLVKDLRHSTEDWMNWYDLERPEEAELPLEYSSKLTEFQQLCVIRCFRPDRVYNAVRNFVIHEMKDDYFVQPPVLEYEKIYQQSTNVSPIVFILSPGADPMGELEKLAEAKGITKANKFRHLALGQGQAAVAEQLLRIGSSRGFWVVLQNCHLMPSWLKTLEKIIETMKGSHEDFRLWLTTDPTSVFPIGILQLSLKVVTEPPDGLKLNMKQSYAKITQQVLEECPHQHFRPLIYVLSFFHAVVQERRKYGKLGWNVAYDFNESDFNVSLRLLDLYLTKTFHSHTETEDNNNKNKNDLPLPWGSLRYLIGEAMYGGRVTDSFDRRVLMTYLNEYFGDFLFDDFQSFYFSNSGFQYKIPEFGDLSKYTSMISQLPLENSPEIFGLHSNAEIDYYTNATRNMFHNLIDMQPRTVTLGKGVRREDYIMKVACDIESKVPEPFDLLAVRKSFEDKFSPSAIGPTTVVLLQELERWNCLITKMSSSLVDLKKALIGEIGMSNDLDDLASCLYNGYLPTIWRKLAPQTQKMLGSWMTHFQKRYEQYKEWVISLKDPKVAWLSGFHIPESFLTALVQTTCRKKKWPLDKSTLYTTVTKIFNPDDIEERMEDGCYVSELYLEGAGWDSEEDVLRRQDPKRLITELPILKVIPIELSHMASSLQNTFKTPVYVTRNRRDAMGFGLVFEADLSTNVHPSHWILQGSAIVLNTDS